MGYRAEELFEEPNALARHYSRFRVQDRILLTGHSHQAWPDYAREGQLAAWDDAARLTDDKWAAAFAQAERVERGFAERLGDGESLRRGDSSYALASCVHDLLVRFLSALPLRGRPKLVTTDGEFHSLRRQLTRLEEEGVEIVRVRSEEPDGIAEALAEAVCDRTAAVLASSVLFQSGRIVPGLGHACAASRRCGAEFVVDAYHQVNVVPFDIHSEGLTEAHVVGGGYKYCQLGEGNCFLRVPAGRKPRPVITGWFAEFERLEKAPRGGVAYGVGAAAYGGATYDPTSQYRASRVFDFLDDEGLTPTFLRQVSQHQVRLLARCFDQIDLDPETVRRPQHDLTSQGGFLVLTAPKAAELTQQLRQREVWVDSRGDALRLGPAPYLSDRQIRDAIGQLGELARTL
ncbi:MAG: kynureninase [Thermoanaerobaculia bacterium]|nr:kynureninase [Thermoanaerobaculia bacterium]